MHRLFFVTVSFLLLATQSACLLLNDVSTVAEPGYTPTSGRSIVVLGLGLEKNWGAPQFPVSLDEYSLERQSITGNCWRFNKIEGAVPGSISPTQYLVFDVATGYYAIGVRNHPTPLAFEVPPNQVVYLGDFIYVGSEGTDLRFDLSKAAAAVKKSYPNIKSELVLAKSVPVPVLQLFLCAP